jgi:hypothetical protein
MNDKLMTSYVNEFNAHFRKSAEEMAKACKAYAAAVKIGGIQAHALFAECHPQITDTMWARIRLCGEGHVLAQILTVGTDAAFKKWSELPIEKQRELLAAPVEVAFVSHGKREVVKLTASDLTTDEMKRAITNTGDRIPPEAQAVRHEKRERPYKIEGKRLIVSSSYVFSEEMLELILLNMKG